MKIRLLILTGLVLSFATAVRASDDAPAWLKEAAAASVPTYDKNVSAVVLRNEETVSVKTDGTEIVTTRYAVRILTRDGRRYAIAVEPYLTKSSKVSDLHAWLIPPGGKMKKFGKDETIDQIAKDDEAYDEYHLKLIVASDTAEAGAVFGYESTREEHALFDQKEWYFQDELPTLVSRYSLVLPTGWAATAVTFNRDKVEPVVSGSSYTWELAGLPPIHAEPLSPTVSNLAPRLAVTYFAKDTSFGPDSRAFKTWSQVSRWTTSLYDPQAVVDDSVAAKARELTVNAKTDLDRIKAIAHFVQSIQYIEIDLRRGSGNGIRPHPATEVLRKAYGDCKDKANLMRTLLKAVNITAYPVAIYSGDSTFVREEWPSPSQFNHCIVAVKVGDDVQLPTVITHPTLGRLLIFDATDPSTPVGDLDEDEQGSFALIIAGEQGSLMRMPIMPPESSRLDRQADVVLSSLGSITATVKENSVGQIASRERGMLKALSASGYRQMIERWVSNGATAAKVSTVEPVDNKNENRFALTVTFSAEEYAQLMNRKLLVFKPAIVSRRNGLALSNIARQYPVVLESNAFTETVNVKLPEGFAVDETPDPVKLNTPFGSYSASYEVKNGELIFTRTLAQRAITVPPEQYAALRNFYSRMLAADQAPVVLARQ